MPILYMPILVFKLGAAGRAIFADNNNVLATHGIYLSTIFKFTFFEITWKVVHGRFMYCYEKNTVCCV